MRAQGWGGLRRERRGTRHVQGRGNLRIQSGEGRCACAGGVGMTLEYIEKSKHAAIAHTLAQITTCIYTQMNHICTKSIRQTSHIYIDGKQNVTRGISYQNEMKLAHEHKHTNT